MKILTKTNWLKELRNDILARQSLYPETLFDGVISSTKWLKILRDDILKRGTLYPNYVDIGPLTKTNFLYKLRDDILARGTLYPEGSPAYYNLARIIDAAKVLLNGTSVSVDGTDILKTSFWVTIGVKTTFSDAIDVAQTILHDKNSDDAQLDSAASALEAAMAVFNSERKPGTGSVTPGGWELTYVQPIKVIMQREVIPLSTFVGYTPSKLTEMDSPTGVYDSSWNPTGNVKLYAKYLMHPEDIWAEVTLDENSSHRPYNRLIMWEWETPNIRITGDNSTGEPIQIRLVMGG